MQHHFATKKSLGLEHDQDARSRFALGCCQQVIEAVMRVLIAYGTTEGQTAKIALFIEDRLISAGIDASRVHVPENGIAPEPSGYSMVIIAASLHLGVYQQPVVDYVRRHAKTLNAMPSVFLSVSLSAASEDDDDLQGLYRCNAAFLKDTGWQPSKSHLVAGAFRFTSYDFMKSWALKYIAWRKGQSTDTTRDHELTDWAELGKFVDELPKLVEGKRTPV